MALPVQRLVSEGTIPQSVFTAIFEVSSTSLETSFKHFIPVLCEMLVLVIFQN